MDRVKEVVGAKEFLSFLNSYLRAPEHTQKLKEEMTRLEKEVLNIDISEEEKQAFGAISALKDTFEQKQFEYSSLSEDIEREFKNAMWIVLTTPVVSKMQNRSMNL